MAGSGNSLSARSGAGTDGQSAFPHGAAVLAEKVDGILASPAFLRSPILSRLLRYLLAKTISGEAETLKAYTIAVEGLDRPPDFDAQIDSYPRVQMVRLRKALETYYAHNPTLPEPYVYLCAGTYALQLESRAVACSKTSRLTRVGAPAIRGLAAIPAAVGTLYSKRGLIAFAVLMLAGLAVLIAIIIQTGRMRSHVVPEASGVHAPVIEIAFREPDVARRGAEISDIMSEALTRSWVTQVRDKTFGGREGAHLPTYRVVLHETENGLETQLIDAPSGMILWTESVASIASSDLRASLGPMIAELVRPFGIIARTETARLPPDSSSSYACVLRYMDFLRSGRAGMRDRIAACLEKPADQPQLAATMAALRAFFTLEAQAWPDREAQLVRAEHYTRIAAQADAEDPYSHYARARLALLRERCADGLLYGDRAIAANPYDATIVTVLSGLVAPCSRTRGTALLDRAYRIRNDNDVPLRTPLVLATIAQRQEKRLSALSYLTPPPAGPQLPGYLLSESLIAASQGHLAEARRLWGAFRRLNPAISSDDGQVRTVVLPDPQRRAVLDYLQREGVTGS